MKVYGVYTGCKYEGGGVKEPLYFNKEDAVKEAEAIFNKHVERDEKRCQKSLTNFDKRLAKEFKWFKSDLPDYWENTVDCIQVLEYEVV